MSFLRLLLAVVLVALAANEAAAYYAPHLGRWVTRDQTDYSDGPNLYQYVQSKPQQLTDPQGNESFGGTAVPIDRPAPGPSIGPVTPLPSNSPECDKYDCDDTYAGANARCFCKCAGDSPWSKYVRGCLRKLYEQGVSPAEAHDRCYKAADKKNFPGGRPYLRLAKCFTDCGGLPEQPEDVDKHWLIWQG